jgi:hypothetical protein
VSWSAPSSPPHSTPISARVVKPDKEQPPCEKTSADFMSIPTRTNWSQLRGCTPQVVTNRKIVDNDWN